MKLQYIFDQLTHGELRKINFGGHRDNPSEVSREHYKLFLLNINLALEDIKTRLPIKTKAATIQQHEHITLYEMDSRFADSNTASPELVKYIMDSPLFPFLDDFLAVDAVYDMGGHELPLNDDNNLHSVYTPEPHIIQFPYPRNNYTFDVRYRYAPAPIPVNDIWETVDPNTYEIDLPHYALVCLLYYVASRVIVGMGRETNMADSDRLMNQFESSINRIKTESVIRRPTFTSQRLEQNGWV